MLKVLKYVRVGSILKIKNLCESFWTAQSEKLARVLSEDLHTSIHRTPVLYTLQLSMIGYFWYNVSYSLLLFCFVSFMAKIRVICYITTICWNSTVIGWHFLQMFICPQIFLQFNFLNKNLAIRCLERI